MKKVCFLLLMCCVLSLDAQDQFRVLLFSKTAGWHHSSIHEGVSGFRELSEKHQFDLVWSDDANRYFNTEAMSEFDVVVFMNTTGDVLNDDQQAALKAFIQSGKGYVGIHAASDTEYGWPWYTQLVGRMFKAHPAVQSAKLDIRDSNFPGFESWPKELWWTDEWYEFGEEKVDGLNYLLTVDEDSYDAIVNWGNYKSDGMGEFHPISWYHDYDGGRAFYTALGHMPAVYSDKLFLDHLYGGLLWAATGKGIKKN